MSRAPRDASAAAVIVGLVVAAIVACGGAKRPAVTASPGSPDHGHAGAVLPASPRERIEQLVADTDAGLDRLGLDRPPAHVAGLPEDARPLADIRTTCAAPPHPGQTCQSVCDLADHICDNATQICELAAELAPDAWAASRCQDGKAACAAARARCCGCQ